VEVWTKLGASPGTIGIRAVQAPLLSLPTSDSTLARKSPVGPGFPKQAPPRNSIAHEAELDLNDKSQVLVFQTPPLGIRQKKLRRLPETMSTLMGCACAAHRSASVDYMVDGAIFPHRKQSLKL
jgi:hypothetical protein